MRPAIIAVQLRLRRRSERSLIANSDPNFPTQAMAAFENGEDRRGALLPKKPSRCEVAHERGRAEGPGLAGVAWLHAVDEPAELRGRDGDEVAVFVGEALARRVAV